MLLFVCPLSLLYMFPRPGTGQAVIIQLLSPSPGNIMRQPVIPETYAAVRGNDVAFRCACVRQACPWMTRIRLEARADTVIWDWKIWPAARVWKRTQNRRNKREKNKRENYRKEKSRSGSKTNEKTRKKQQKQEFGRRKQPKGKYSAGKKRKNEWKIKINRKKRNNHRREKTKFLKIVRFSKITLFASEIAFSERSFVISGPMQKIRRNQQKKASAKTAEIL